MPRTFDRNKPSDRWKWFEHKGWGIRLELYGPKTDEWSSFAQRYGIGGDQADVPGARVFIAKNWIRGVEGFNQPDGTPHENTPDLRAFLLNEFPEVWMWALGRFQVFTLWRDEGNADSGSVS